MLDRVSTLSVHQKTLNDVTTTQAKIGKANVQISSGKQFSDFRELADDGTLEKVFSLETEIRNTDRFISNNTLISARLQTMSSRLDNIIDIISDQVNLLVSYRSGSKTSIELEQLSRDALDKLEGELNANLEGRYLFAGSKTDRPAVDRLQSSNIVDNTPTSNYYNGDDTRLEARVTDTLDISYGITANDQGFVDLIAALHLSIEAHQSGSELPLTKTNGAADLLQGALDRVRALQTQTGIQIGHVEDAAVRHQDYKTYVKGIIGDLTDTDIAATTISLTTDQTILQASFMMFSRLSNLTLTNYLN